ncbi:hypothetical protein LTR15_003534 [Elasticomyces elasticus]|nr:hypothetical protein LTR15_003534 [Elasticomyces elasticus]
MPLTPIVNYYLTMLTTGLGTVAYGNISALSTVQPGVVGSSYTWSQSYTPVQLGTVFVIINNYNQTTLSTSTDKAALASNTQFVVQNGTMLYEGIVRTDVNEAGTVTAAVPTGLSSENSTLAYPTPYFTVGGSVTWSAAFPSTITNGFYGEDVVLSAFDYYGDNAELHGQTEITQTSGICCLQTVLSSPIPQNHDPWPSRTGSTNSADPRGWLYVLTMDPVGYQGYHNVSSLLAPASINIVLNDCNVVYPGNITPSCGWGVAGAEQTAVNPYGELLTTTVHITTSASTSSALPSAEPAEVAQPSTPRTAVRVDPITAGVQPSIVSQTSSTLPASLSSSAPTNVIQDSSLSEPSRHSTVPTDTAVTSVQSSLSVNPASIIVPLFASHATQTITTSYEKHSGSMSASQENSLPTQSGVTSNVQSGEALSSTEAIPEPPPISSNSLLQSDPLGTTTTGSIVVNPGVIIGSETVPLGSTVSVGGIPIAVVTSGSRTYAIVGTSSSAITVSAVTGPHGTTDEPGLSGATFEQNPHAFSITLSDASSTVKIVLQTQGSDTTLTDSTAKMTEIPAPVPIVVGSTTISLTPGGLAAAVSGTTYRIASDSTELVIGTRTAEVTSSAGLGSYILSGIGQSAGPSPILPSAGTTLESTDSSVVAIGGPSGNPVEVQINSGVVWNVALKLAVGMACLATLLCTLVLC